MNDFRDVPGIANLVVLLLVAGTKSHSKMWFEFNKMMKLRGGHMENLSTLDSQIFSFSIEPNCLMDNLDW